MGQVRCQPTAIAVKTANRNFYDHIAGHYEALDGRRTPALRYWLRAKLKYLKSQVPGEKMLDLGTGSGVVTACAQGIFDQRVGVDISYNMLSSSQSSWEMGAVADVDLLPFSNHSFDLVTGFAVLHHLYAFDPLIREIARVLKPGGICYTDHDMDLAFRNRFKRSLALYRWVKQFSGKHGPAGRKIDPRLHQLTEYQANGIDSQRLLLQFKSKGFSVRSQYHWFGLAWLIDQILGVRDFKQGWAPLFAMTAQKGS